MKAMREKYNQLLHTPEGVRDIYGAELLKRNSVIGRIRERMRLYGYSGIQTPTFEFFDVFSSEIGTTPSRELYKFFDKEGNTLVLRPDFTPSVARCAAKYGEEGQGPMRFAYQGSTFVNASSLQGKLNESAQMGIELIGEASARADAEAVALLIECLRDSGLSRFQVSVGNAGYFRGMCEEAGIDPETENELRDDISGKNYYAAEKLLLGLEIPDRIREKILNVTVFSGSAETLDEALLSADNARSAAAIESLKDFYEALKNYGVERYVSFDLSMLSKYDYYTGIIFRGYTYGVGEAIAAGGRYDRLISHFGQDMPAVGFMIQTEYLQEALRSQHIEIPVPDAPVVIPYTKESYAEAVARALALRAEGTAAVLAEIPEAAGTGSPDGGETGRAAGDSADPRETLGGPDND